MGWIGLSLFVTFIVIVITYFLHRSGGGEKWYSMEEVQAAGFVSFFGSLILIGVIGGAFSSADGRLHNGNQESCEKIVNKWNIVSAVRDEKVSSSFILGTGGTRTVDRYYVYRQEEPGLMFTEYNAHKTYVVEQDGQPYYERIDYVCPQPIYDFLWWSSNNTHRNIGKYGTLYVPENTILREFKM